ncbi:hypothetical protein BD769DRAFT_1684434 [Suillus cothurnatus]|nr:hypothetical protein BD769DRAFT_1684434 [Suillus cothurnatus]
MSHWVQCISGIPLHLFLRNLVQKAFGRPRPLISFYGSIPLGGRFGHEFSSRHRPPSPFSRPSSPLLFIPTALERPPVPSPTSPPSPLLFIPTALERPPVPPFFLFPQPSNVPRPSCIPSPAFPGPITKIPPFPLPCFLVPSPTFPSPLSPPSPLFPQIVRSCLYILPSRFYVRR